MHKGKENFMAKVIVGILVISIVLLFFGFALYGFIGVVKVGTYFEVVEIHDQPSLFYFGSLLFLIYILLLCIEMLVRIGIRLWSVKQSVPKTIFLYVLQVVVGTGSVKLLLDQLFNKIEVSLLVLSAGVAIIYAIVFFGSGAHRGMDDIWDD